MRKTIIALTLASAFAAPAMAQRPENVPVPPVDIEINQPKENVVSIHKNKIGTNVVKYNGKAVGVISGDGVIVNKDGEVVGTVGATGEGNFSVTDSSGHTVDVNVDDNGTVFKGSNENGSVAKPLPPRPDNGTANPDLDMNVKPNQDSINQGVNGSISDIYKQGGQVIDQASKAYADIDSRVGKLEVNFDNFKAETDRKFKEMDQRLDATNASLHAVTNARPMVSNGQTAFGVGTGFAGSAQAIAVGVAHSFEDSGWSASATINQTTGGYSEFNGGAGVQYAF